MKNYYQILRVKPTASDDEIKRSYRVLAKRFHPDVNPNDSTAADRFADINEAYDTLSDRQKRTEYDVKLAEASAPKPKPEDIIARQRAQAQAAARQAAMRNMHADATAAFGARAQAAAHAQAQAQAQAQIAAIKNQAFQAGRERGAAEASALAQKELSKLKAEAKTLAAENKSLKRELEEERAAKSQLTEAERDRRELERELFIRDRELAQEKIRAKEMEERLSEMRNGAKNRTRDLEAEMESMLAKERERSAALEHEKYQAELRNKAQIQLQLDKRKQMQEEIDELNRQIQMLTTEVEELRAENDQWQQYAQSEEFLSDAERKLQDWSKKTNADRRLAKTTLYGALGVLIWATSEEIAAAYIKLKKRYANKADDENIAAKLEKIETAYATLSDPQKRIEYNESIGYPESKIEEERKLVREFAEIEAEYRKRIASKEFWEHYDELTSSALEGNAASQNSLGELYYEGDELEQDFEQAVFWFKEAAKQKHPDAMYNLGICFINGEGVEQNKSTGLGFIRQAAKLGSKAAKQYNGG